MNLFRRIIIFGMAMLFVIGVVPSYAGNFGVQCPAVVNADPNGGFSINGTITNLDTKTITVKITVIAQTHGTWGTNVMQFTIPLGGTANFALGGWLTNPAIPGSATLRFTDPVDGKSDIIDCPVEIIPYRAPSLTQWGLILLILAVAGFFGYVILRRRRIVISNQ
jgi:hypothetical protein